MERDPCPFISVAQIKPTTGGMRWRGPGTPPEPGRRPWRNREGPSKARAHWALRPGPPAHSAVGSSTPFQLAADRDMRQLAACAGDAAGASRRTRHEALWHTGAAGGEHFAARARAARPGTLRMGLWHTRPLTCAPLHWAWDALAHWPQAGTFLVAHYRGGAAGPGALQRPGPQALAHWPGCGALPRGWFNLRDWNYTAVL